MTELTDDGAESCWECGEAATIYVDRIETAYEYHPEGDDYKNHPIGENMVYDYGYWCARCYVKDTHYIAGKFEIMADVGRYGEWLDG